MIQLGICTAAQYAPQMKQIGFDYIELGMSATARLTDAEFAETKRILADCGLPCEAMNGMLPPEVRVTGSNVQAQKIHDYLDLAFGRARELGVKVVVFGSGGARAVPDGFEYAQAWRQLANYLRMAERHAHEHDLTIAIEPLRRAECNIINYVSEATLLASLVNMPHIGVLGDLYHMVTGSEPLSSLTQAGELLQHIHVANGIGRWFPKPRDGENYAGLFETLTNMGYSGRVSIEGKTNDLLTDAAVAYRYLDQLRSNA